MKKPLCFFFVAFLLIDFTGCATKTDSSLKKESSEKVLEKELEKPINSTNDVATASENNVWDASKLEGAREDFSKNCLGFGLPESFNKEAFCKVASVCVSEKVAKEIPYNIFMAAQTAEQVNTMTDEEYSKVKPYTDKLIKITKRCLSESTSVEP